jgi:hypothetical protein
MFQCREGFRVVIEKRGQAVERGIFLEFVKKIEALDPANGFVLPIFCIHAL